MLRSTAKFEHLTRALAFACAAGAVVVLGTYSVRVTLLPGFQVFWAIVVTLAVFVVYVFGGLQVSAEKLLHDETVFGHEPALLGMGVVRCVDFYVTGSSSSRNPASRFLMVFGKPLVMTVDEPCGPASPLTSGGVGVLGNRSFPTTTASTNACKKFLPVFIRH